MQVKLYTNENAKRHIRKIKKSNIEFESMHIERWLSETNDVKCYVLVENENVKNICLLSKCNFDPHEKHKNPYVLDFIYTFAQDRRKNLAFQMLIYLKQKEQTTSFCSNEESENLFKKAQYNFYGGPTYRFP